MRDPLIPAAPTPSRPSGGRVLLVDDDALVRRQTRRALESAGYDVIDAGCPGDAIAIACDAGTDIALLVSDVRMPGMGGPTLARRLRAELPGLRVLFTSGFNDDTLRQHGAGESGAAFLEKPYSPATLIEKVRAILAPHE